MKERRKIQERKNLKKQELTIRYFKILNWKFIDAIFLHIFNYKLKTQYYTKFLDYPDPVSPTGNKKMYAVLYHNLC